MGFSIRYCSTEMMHPAQAYAIKQQAAQLNRGYCWLRCGPAVFDQQSDGHLLGQSELRFGASQIDGDPVPLDELADGTVLILAEVLCTLSRDHGVDWNIGHDYEPDSIGLIQNGVANADLMAQLEAIGCMGDLLDDGDAESVLETVDLGLADQPISEESVDEDEPTLLKFPGTEL